MKDVGYSATASYVCSSDDAFNSCSDLIYPLCVQEARFTGDFEGFWEDTDQCQTSGQSVRYPCMPVSVPDLAPASAHISFNITHVLLEVGSGAEVVCVVKLICSCVCVYLDMCECVCMH